MREKLLEGYIASNYSGACLSSKELAVLKEGSLEQMVSTFVRVKNDSYKEQLQGLLKTVKLYFGDTITLEAVREVSMCKAKFIACQVMDGDDDIFLGLYGDEQVLLKLASVLAAQEFECFDEDTYDAICEFINCVNGLYATKLSGKGVEVTLRPPVFYNELQIMSEKGFYNITLAYMGQQFNVVLVNSERVYLEK